MTVPGLGGQQQPPFNSPAGAALTPGVTPGTTGIVVATRVIIIGSGGELLVYSPTAGAGNLIASIAGSAGTDSFGNGFFPGVCSYSSTGISQVYNGIVAVGIAGQGVGGSNTVGPGLFSNDGGNAGITQVTSGQKTNSSDIVSTILLQSQNESGVTSGEVSLNAGIVNVGASGAAQWDDLTGVLTIFTGIGTNTTATTAGDITAGHNLTATNNLGVDGGTIFLGTGTTANIQMNPTGHISGFYPLTGASTLAQVATVVNSIAAFLIARGMCVSP